MFSLSKVYSKLFMGAIFVGALFVFLTCMTMTPLYSGDQLTYMAYGFSKLGVGQLAQDWVLQLQSPYPFFDTIVMAIKTVFGDAGFYGAHVLFAGLYLFFLTHLGFRVTGSKWGWGALFLFFILMTLLHSLWLDEAILYQEVFHPEKWVRGVGNQYLFTKHFLPSSFDILLLGALFLVLKNHRVLPMVLLGLDVLIHPAMVLANTLLGLGILVGWYKAQLPLKKIVGLAWIAIGVALPSLLYLLHFMAPDIIHFFKTGTHLPQVEIFQTMRAQLSQNPNVWLDRSVLLKGIILGVAWFWIRKTALYPIWRVSLVLAIGFTVLQILFKSQLLALLMPWRVLVVWMPLSTAVLLAAVCDRLWRLSQFNWVLPTVLTLAVGAMLLPATEYGWLKMQNASALRHDLDGEWGVIQWVKAHPSPNDLVVIPPDMELFRIHAQVPIFVDYKVFPTSENGILTWRDRLMLVNNLYKTPEFDPNILKRIQEMAPVTYLVWAFANPPFLDRQPVYSNAQFSVWEIRE